MKAQKSTKKGGLYWPRRRPWKLGCPTCGDVFSGAGGLAEGFRQAGFSVLFGVDSDKAAGETFRHNFPEASFFALPVASVAASALLKDTGLKRGELDCLIGGPPCQSFSYNNHQRSNGDGRALLFRDYLALVRELQPKFLVMENVPGILTIGDGAVVREIRDRLGELGYQSEFRILYSEDFGVPQTRRRVFLLASRVDDVSALFPRGTYGPCPKPSEVANPLVHRWKRPHGGTRREPPSVWQALADLIALPNGGGEEIAPYAGKPRSTYQRRMRGSRTRVFNHVAPALSKTVLRRIKHVPEGGSWRDIPRRLLPAGMRRARLNDHTKRYGRLDRRGLCCTILTKCDPHWGSYIHPTQDRAISVREAARLQSFPDRFRFKGFRSEQYEQVGNAVPPLMAAAVARSIKRAVKRLRKMAKKTQGIRGSVPPSVPGSQPRSGRKRQRDS